MQKIFYIEKEPFLRKMFELILQVEGVEVYTTGKITDCLFQVSEMESTILLVDIETLMPVKDQFLKDLVNDGYCSHIPVVAVGFPSKLELVAQEDWYAGTIKKPISAHNLLQTILDSVVK